MPKSNNKPFKITGDMVIADVINAFPQTIEVFLELGIHCVGCYVANFESIEEGVSRHGQDPETVVNLLNKAIKTQNVRKRAVTAKSGGKRNPDLSRSRRAKR